MATVVSRSPSAPQRAPRKKHSFLNLRRDRSLDTKIDKSLPPPASYQPGYFELYPGRSESKSECAGAKSEECEQDVFTFPSVRVRDTTQDLQLTPQAPRARQRSRTSPESRLPPLRFSGSSAFSHSPPVTPTSPSPPEDARLSTVKTFKVLMSAPIVETTAMDALVDGMNGGEEDVFSTMDAMRGNRRRKKSAVSSKAFHHPLYHPPLPTPPPGIKLGGAVSRAPGDSDADDDSEGGSGSVPRPSRPRPSSSRHGSTSTITPPRPHRSNKLSRQLPSPPPSVSPPPRPTHNASDISPSPPVEVMSTNASIDEIVRRFVSVNDTPPKAVVPSISDIIRIHAPEHAHKRHRPRLSVTTTPPSPVAEDLGTQSHDDPSDFVSRSSIDSIAEEVQKTLRASRKHPAALHHAHSFSRAPAGQHQPSTTSQGSTSIRSPRSDGGYRSPSLSSFSTSVNTAPSHSPHTGVGTGTADAKSDNLALATFLRSPRLTKLLTLKRSPNARLQVSFSDLGSSTGKPVVVFLGLGSVRYIMGLYDEMAEALGLRLITIDRWGLGRTDDSKRNAPRGVKEWSSVVEEVLDHLNIDRCSILAHSAGAPYAMAFANRSPERIQGALCLLAPWVGAGEGASGYRWLKYVPTGLIKTAQAAEWKVQAWMLGKPPAITYSGIGYDLRAPVSSSAVGANSGRPSLATSLRLRESRESGRSSLSSFSDYDDLGDFKGNYASRSTIHVNEGSSQLSNPPPMPRNTSRSRAASKSSRFFGGLWKNSESSSTSSPGSAKASPKLKSLKSLGSLRGAASLNASRPARPQTTSCPSSGYIMEDGNRCPARASTGPLSPRTSCTGSLLPEATRGQSRARRSISLNSAASSPSHVTHPPSLQSKGRYFSSPPPTESYAPAGPSNAALGNALLAASHAESSRGTHADLLQILNHSQKPWGFSYDDFSHPIKVWYGDKDEKIAEGAVRWMKRTMRPGLCDLVIVKGAGHGLMYNGGVVVEALEFLKETWAD